MHGMQKHLQTCLCERKKRERERERERESKVRVGEGGVKNEDLIPVTIA